MAQSSKKAASSGPRPNHKDIYCRLCLTDTLTTKYKMLSWLFDSSRTLTQTIEDFAQIKMVENDKFSKLVCSRCIDKLRAAVKFKTLIIDSDSQLKNRFIETHDELQVEMKNLSTETPFFEQKIKVEETKLITEIKVEDLDPLDDNNEDFSADNLSPEIPIKATKKKRIRLYRYAVKCPDCSEILRTYTSIKIHSKVHPNLNRYHCTVCNKGFWLKSEWLKHEAIHQDKADYQCEICGKAFKHVDGLRAHKIIHSETNFKCDQCDKVFKRRSTLNQHKLSHTNEFNFECATCHRKFQSSLERSYHSSRTHRPVKKEHCYICGKLVAHLKYHLKCHSKPYKCDICNQSFGTNKILTNHKISHTDERPFSCDICHKTFKHNESLLKHKRAHDPENRFTCEYCNKEFNYKHLLKGHMPKCVNANTENLSN